MVKRGDFANHWKKNPAHPGTLHYFSIILVTTITEPLQHYKSHGHYLSTFNGITQEKYVQHIILIVAFHFNCACMKIISRKMNGSSFSEILLEAALYASGYLQGVLSGKHYDSPSLPQPGKSIFLQIHWKNTIGI